MGQSWFC